MAKKYHGSCSKCDKEVCGSCGTQCGSCGDLYCGKVTKNLNKKRKSRKRRNPACTGCSDLSIVDKDKKGFICASCETEAKKEEAKPEEAKAEPKVEEAKAVAARRGRRNPHFKAKARKNSRSKRRLKRRS